MASLNIEDAFIHNVSVDVETNLMDVKSWIEKLIGVVIMELVEVIIRTFVFIQTILDYN